MSEVHGRLQELAKPCFAGSHLPPHAEFRFSYRLTMQGGEARLSDVALVWSDLKSAEIEGCLLQKLAVARWSTTEPDWSTTAEDAVTDQ
jgi:hypothetical protein